MLLTFCYTLMLSFNKVPDFQSLTYKDSFTYHYGYIPDIAGGYRPETGLPAWFPSMGIGAVVGMTVITQLLSCTKVGFTSVYDIIGGSGKFAGARGQIRETGYFNPVDTTEDISAAAGRITY